MMLISSLLMVSGSMEAFSGMDLTLFWSLAAKASYDSITFIFMLSLVSTMVLFWSAYYMSYSYKTPMFFICLMSFILSMAILLESDSLLTIFLGWEGLGISSFLLIVFYQNWMSMRGGMLTLMTNRIGDAMMMISVSYLLGMMMNSFRLLSVTLFLVLVLLVTTKSAQWPFISWLPAAMAAPTPISALVHSSTLVTAGVWLSIRFYQTNSISLSFWLFIGMTTMVVASMAAFVEPDGKKVVALSTLSQLGVMFISLSMGNQLICLFHVVTHALAKANLFMMVGSLLHSQFSEQDVRGMTAGSMPLFTKLSIMISIFSLSGLLFTTSFYSKESILANQWAIVSSILSWIMLVALVTLTMAYCAKLIFMVSHTHNSLLGHVEVEMYSMIPSMVLASFSLVGGFVLWNNMTPVMSFSSGNYSYWLLLMLAMLALLMFTINSYVVLMGFSLVTKLTNWFSSYFFLAKKVSTIEHNMVEGLYILLSLTSMNFYKSNPRFLVILVFMVFTVMVF